MLPYRHPYHCSTPLTATAADGTNIYTFVFSIKRHVSNTQMYLLMGKIRNTNRAWVNMKRESVQGRGCIRIKHGGVVLDHSNSP